MAAKKGTATAMQKPTARNFAILITGVPGTGKSTIAKLLSEQLSAAHIDIGKLAVALNLYSHTDSGDGAKVVKLPQLERELGAAVKSEQESRPVLLEGHLGCEMKLPVSKVFVLRCEPKTLRARLAPRGYSSQKVAQNALSEALDYCTVQSEKNYGARKVWEIDTTVRTPSEVSCEMRSILSGKKKRKEKISWPDALVREAITGEKIRGALSR